jgi:hypothetical protein
VAVGVTEIAEVAVTGAVEEAEAAVRAVVGVIEKTPTGAEGACRCRIRQVFYILNEEGDPVLVPTENLRDFVKAGSLFEDMARRRVAETRQSEDFWVSTVFLMIDHKMGGSEPVLWETMIFGGSHDGYQERSRTLEEAILQHRQAVRVAFPVDPPETIWGVLPRLRPDGSIGPAQVKEVLGRSIWERLMNDALLV